MKIHREGHTILLVSLLLLTGINLIVNRLTDGTPLLIGVGSAAVWLFVLFFFRNPKRMIPGTDDNLVYAPADGRVVVIEETEEGEFFKDRRLQVSIFMSPLNVHVNLVPLTGKVTYFRYHPGRFLIAWQPKSSHENEKTTIVINNGHCEVLLRQIAGAMARRIKTYIAPGDFVQQGEELGFIKFGSRVDLFLPPDSEVKVAIGDEVKGNRTVIAKLPDTIENQPNLQGSLSNRNE